MAANSLERLSEVILPKSGKERQDVGDSEKGAVFQDRQEMLTYGNWIKGEPRVSVQLFESPNPQSLSNVFLLTIAWVKSEALVNGNVGKWKHSAERTRIHCSMKKSENCGFDFSWESSIDILSKSCDWDFFFERLISVRILNIYRTCTNLE